MSTYDYVEHHQQARQTHCASTCQWILNEPYFKAWVGSRPSSLWLSGPAGSGKTVLASFVIEYLQRNASPTDVIAYFYCNANTSQSLSTETIMASLLAQLCGSAIPTSISKLFRQSAETGQAPRALTVDQLTSVLGEVIKSIGNPIIVVDGIDEASHPEVLCNILHLLTSLPGSWLRLFLSSRPDVEIDAALVDVSRLCASKQVLTEDIKTYVKHRLAADRKLARLSEDTRTHICRALVNKSEGM
jgi:Cdc6-like AAA superfamily ATPase